MQKLLPKLWERRAKPAKDDKGFTLIELLVVVVILGVLIAIAIPLYLNYRKGANDASAESDMRNAINVLESCNTDNGNYPTAVFAVTATAAAGTCTAQTINLSSGTSLTYTPVGVGISYTIVNTNTNGAGKYFCYNSTKGGQVKAITAASYAAAVTAGCP